jgi:large subunit ribosomal protein L25
MRSIFEVSAESRNDQGKGASRRLRHAGKVPAIMYGAGGTPTALALSHQKLILLVDNEKFYSTIVTVNVDGAKQHVIVKDVQMHPAKNAIVHVDLQRVLEDQPIRLHLPIHFLNEASSPGVKLQGGSVSHMRSDIEISCLPKDLPEALEVDLGAMGLNEPVMLSQLKLPPDVTIPDLAHGHDAPVVVIHPPRVEVEEAAVETVAAAAPAADAKAPAGKAAAAAPAAAKAPAAKAPAKK